LLVARILGAGAMGSIAVSLGLAGLCLAILLPGFGQAHLKRLAEGQDAGRCLGTMGLIQAGGVGALMVGLVSARALGVLEAAPDLTPVFVLVLGAQVASNVADIFLKVFIAREWIVEHALVVLVARLARLGATVAVLAIAPSVTLVAATFSIEGVLAAALGAGVLARRHDIRPRAANRASVREYWIYARPFMVTTPLALIQDSVDRVLVGRWAGLVAAGHYHVARALWEALSSIIAAFNTLLFTRLASSSRTRSTSSCSW
jgi:O-antigen/teichoic acid export membrane protein